MTRDCLGNPPKLGTQFSFSACSIRPARNRRPARITPEPEPIAGSITRKPVPRRVAIKSQTEPRNLIFSERVEWVQHESADSGTAVLFVGELCNTWIIYGVPWAGPRGH